MSKIFTDAELKEIDRRKKGDRNDSYGVFSSRIRPKIIELIEIWFPKRSELKSLVDRIGSKRGGKK